MKRVIGFRSLLSSSDIADKLSHLASLRGLLRPNLSWLRNLLPLLSSTTSASFLRDKATQHSPVYNRKQQPPFIMVHNRNSLAANSHMNGHQIDPDTAATTRASPESSSTGTKRKRDSEPKFYAVRVGFRPGIYYSW